MSLLYRWKPLKDRVLGPFYRALSSAGVTPTMVTATGLAVSAAAGLIAVGGHLHVGIAVFVAGALLDALDGSLARTSGGTSEFGLYLDSVCDRCSEAVFVLGAVISGVTPLAIAVVAGSVLLLSARVRNHRRGLDSHAAVFGRPERLALLVAGMLAPFPLCPIFFVAGGLLGVLSAWLVVVSAAGPSHGA